MSMMNDEELIRLLRQRHIDLGDSLARRAAEALEQRNQSLLQWSTAVTRLYSGGANHFKINCDALSNADLDCAAKLLCQLLPPFGRVFGIPRGGERLAQALEPFRSEGPLLLVDDVLTTGKLMEQVREDSSEPIVIGAVIFAWGPCPEWVTPLFTLNRPVDPLAEAE